MTMTTTRLAEILGIEQWPDSYVADFDRFCTEWDDIKALPLLDMAAVDELIAEEYFDPAGLEDIKACIAQIEADEELHFALQCVYYVLREYRYAHQNELYIEPVPPTLGDLRYTFSMLILLKLLVRGVAEAKSRGIPDEALAENKGAANGDLLANGHYGTPNMFHWRVVCAYGTMYHAGIMRYEPERVPEGYRMVRRKTDGKLLMLYTAARSFDAYGQFTGDPAKMVFSTSAASGATDGYVFSPDGRVLDRYVDLDENAWDVVLDSGDAALSFHIPPDCTYTIGAMVDSFRKAVAFYATYYPEMPIRSIQSYSWLYSPQLRYMLPPTSGINRLNEQLYLAPVPSGADGFYSFVFKTDGASFDVNTAATDTSLKRGFIEFVKNGGDVHNGFMYFPTSEVARLSETARELIAWDFFAE